MRLPDAQARARAKQGPRAAPMAVPQARVSSAGRRAGEAREVRQEKYHDPNPVVGFVIRRFFERIGGVLADLRPQSLLDAGCGEGEMLRRGVMPKGSRTVLLDRNSDSAAHLIGSVVALP